MHPQGGHSRSASKGITSGRNSSENLHSASKKQLQDQKESIAFNRTSVQSVQTQKNPTYTHSRNLSKETIKIVNQSEEQSLVNFGSDLKQVQQGGGGGATSENMSQGKLSDQELLSVQFKSPQSVQSKKIQFKDVRQEWDEVPVGGQNQNSNKVEIEDSQPLEQQPQIKKKPFLRKGKSQMNQKVESTIQVKEDPKTGQDVADSRVIKSNSPDKDVPWWEKSSGTKESIEKKQVKKKKKAQKSPQINKFSEEEEKQVVTELNDEQVQKKKEYLKRRTKYDPQKAIQEAQEKQTLKQLNSNENSKITERQETPKFQLGKKKAQPLNSQDFNLDKPNNLENIERDQKLGSPLSFGIQKKDKIKFQKFNWEKVESRVNCWGSRLTAPKRSQNSQKTPDRPSHSPDPTLPKDFQSSGKKFYDIDIDEQVKVGKFISPNKKSLQMLKQSKQSSVDQSQVQRKIKIDELEKAYSINFSQKQQRINRQIYNLQRLRKQNVIKKSLIPILQENSIFVMKFDPQQFDQIVNEMETHYEQIQQMF